jgi:hypothetical protein
LISGSYLGGEYEMSFQFVEWFSPPTPIVAEHPLCMLESLYYIFNVLRVDISSLKEI